MVREDAPPKATSAAAAVAALQAELEMLERALDTTDRKAALLPVAVAGIGGLFIVPDATLTGAQVLALLPGVASGAISAILALRVLRTTYLSFGPNAQQSARSTHFPPAYYNRAVAGSLADAIDLMSDVLRRKAGRLNVAMSFGGAAILLFALVRVAGGTT